MTGEVFLAHSENSTGVCHRLAEHLRNTAELARSFAPTEELGGLFRFAGLLHDIGKFQDDFQRYLREGHPRTPHAGIGAFVAKKLATQHIPLQFAIQGHHAGLPNNQERKENNEYYGKQENLVDELIDRFRISDLGPQDLIEARDSYKSDDLLLAECATRLLFSALTDADWLDTERHFNRELSDVRVARKLDHEALLAALEKRFDEFPRSGLINELRTQARVEAGAQTHDEIGFYSLQLPTGLGKTLASVYWALLHARYHRLQRIIIVLPYINIIDQTAKTLKAIFGEEAILEHHSGLVDEMAQKGEYAEGSVGSDADLARRLACENWDAPIIVTTTVQFFESLFSNGPFRCRKNHNVASSVVIFDEVQTLPKEYAEPIIIMLKNFRLVARTSFLFCTATQPAFAKRGEFDGIDNIKPLIKRTDIYFDATRRVDFTLLNDLEEISFEVLAEHVGREHASYLVIVNTKSMARDLFQRIERSGTHERCYHLSTAMCPHHRKVKTADIIRDLEAQRKIAVVSTQLVEAGVDFDFPCVYRAMGPLDSIIQAAGRCNRNGCLPERGRVVLFHPEQHKMPDATYRACAEFAKVMIKDDPELLHRHNSFERYYEQVLQLFVDADRYRITEQRKKFNFRDVAESFRLIDEPTTSLFIKEYSDESNSLLDDLFRQLENGKITRNQWRNAQQFSVQVYPIFLREHATEIEVVKDFVRVWHGHYDKNTGLSPKEIETVF
ncbi:MAG: CRISPR-associated helicase Cas3' [Bacteroidota bacterium]